MPLHSPVPAILLPHTLDRPGVGPVSTFIAHQTPETTKLKGWTAGDQLSVRADVNFLGAFCVAVISGNNAEAP